ncbi:MAG: hypothetical protein LUQ50_08730 [Methanospirillum sp.]|uniref:hypothetical protein n=1 Tax=Methanospirillum sp. TaxID=45200 RepID=UPI00236A0E10|nr:hypothetical protein [Methanospirillum sp.]MDD1729142.1 hypothetical protein [Methanospirillum sp.]
MSEGLAVLGFIHSRGGCLLSELSVEMGVPLSSLHGWVDMLCSTGYLKRCEQDHGECPCSKSGSRCVACRCSCHAVQAGKPMKIEVTERGMAMVRRSSDEISKDEVVSDYGRLPRSNICPE